MGLRVRLSGLVRNPVRWALSQLNGKKKGVQQAEDVLDRIDDAGTEQLEGAVGDMIAGEAEKELLRRLARPGKDHLR